MSLKINLYNRERYKTFKSEKRCTKCGNQDERTLKGYVECKECASKAIDHATNHVMKLKLEQRCIICGRRDERTLTGKTYCERCAIKAKVKRLKKQGIPNNAIVNWLVNNITYDKRYYITEMIRSN